MSRLLEERGAEVIDADRVGHELYAPNTDVTTAVATRFGPTVIGSNGAVDRPALGRIVFQDAAALAELESLVVPAIRKAIVERILASLAEVVVVEAFKLLEEPVAGRIDAVWFVDAPLEVRQSRLMADRGLSAEDALRRIQAQPEGGDKSRPADVVLINDGSLEGLEAQVDAAWGLVLTTLAARHGSRSGAP